MRIGSPKFRGVSTPVDDRPYFIPTPADNDRFDNCPTCPYVHLHEAGLDPTDLKAGHWKKNGVDMSPVLWRST